MAIKEGPYLILQANSLPKLANMVNEEMEKSAPRSPIGGPILVGRLYCQAMFRFEYVSEAPDYMIVDGHVDDQGNMGTSKIIQIGSADVLTKSPTTTSYGVLPEEKENEG